MRRSHCALLFLTLWGVHTSILPSQARSQPAPEGGVAEAAPGDAAPAAPAGPAEDAPRSLDSTVALVVTHLLDHDHLSRHPLDDEISERAINAYLSGLDRRKLYFSQQDVDEFMQDRDHLDDQLKAKDLRFAFRVYHRLRERVAERTQLAHELLDAGFDFSVDEQLVLSADDITYAKDDGELRERWRQFLKYEVLLLRAEDTPLEEAISTIRKRHDATAREIARMRHDDILERFLRSVTNAFDPHTDYFSPATLNDFNIRMSLNYQGIGAELETNDAGQAIIRRVMPGGGADQGGQLKAKDRIVRVGQGNEGEMVDVTDKGVDEIIELIRGKEGTVVRVGVIPDEQTEEQIYKITRTRIELEDSAAKGRVLEQGKRADGSPFKIGVIDLPSFYMDMRVERGTDFRSTTRDVRKIIEDFKQQHVDAVVLDLRRNGGGSLSEAIGLTGLFLDGPVVQVRYPNGEIQKHNDTEPGMAWSGPLIVMTSKFSASASEILAGAVQDYHRGLIVGDTTTHGKGTVQSLMDLSQRLGVNLNLGALKITMQQFYRPGGDSTQERGVAADITLPSYSDVIGEGEGHLKYALAFDQVPTAKFDTFPLVNDDLVRPLREASEARRKESAEFRRLTEGIERFKTQRERKTAPLEEQKFLAMRKEMDGDAEQQAIEQLEPQQDEAKDFYLDEVLSIAVDYIQALAQQNKG